MIKNFNNPREFNKYRRENKNYIRITDGLGLGYILTDIFNLMIKTEGENLYYIDEFNNSNRKYNYKTIEKLVDAINRNRNFNYIYIGNENLKNELKNYLK